MQSDTDVATAEATRDQHVTITLKSGHTLEFNCVEFTTTKNGLQEAIGFSWENADRYVWLKFEEVAAVTVETAKLPSPIPAEVVEARWRAIKSHRYEPY